MIEERSGDCDQAVIKIQDKGAFVSPMNHQDPERLPDYKVLSRNSQTRNSTANPNVK
jgi:hypothetical protein